MFKSKPNASREVERPPVKSGIADFPVWRKEASEVEFDAKIAKEKEELEEKNTKKAADFDKKVKKLNYERRIQQLNMETYLEIKHRQEYMKNIKKQSKPTSMLTDS